MSVPALLSPKPGLIWASWPRTASPLHVFVDWHARWNLWSSLLKVRPANKPTCSGFPDDKPTEAPLPPVPPATLMTVLNVCRFVFSIRTWTESVMEQGEMQMSCSTAVWALFNSALLNHVKAVPAELLMTCLVCTQISVTTLLCSHWRARPSDGTTVTCCLMLSMLSSFSCRSVVVLLCSVFLFCFIFSGQAKWHAMKK